MWIASRIGWFSIVVKGQELHVRGRSLGDVKNLAARLGGKPVYEYPEADYPFRLILPRGDLYTIMDIFATMVTYSNFKEEISKIPSQQDKLDAYHEVWATMAQWAKNQTPREAH